MKYHEIFPSSLPNSGSLHFHGAQPQNLQVTESSFSITPWPPPLVFFPEDVPHLVPTATGAFAFHERTRSHARRGERTALRSGIWGRKPKQRSSRPKQRAQSASAAPRAQRFWRWFESDVLFHRCERPRGFDTLYIKSIYYINLFLLSLTRPCSNVRLLLFVPVELHAISHLHRQDYLVWRWNHMSTKMGTTPSGTGAIAKMRLVGVAQSGQTAGGRVPSQTAWLCPSSPSAQSGLHMWWVWVHGQTPPDPERSSRVRS